MILYEDLILILISCHSRSEKRRIDQNGGPPSEWPYFTAVEDVLSSVDASDRTEESIKFNGMVAGNVYYFN